MKYLSHFSAVHNSPLRLLLGICLWLGVCGGPCLGQYRTFEPAVNGTSNPYGLNYLSGDGFDLSGFNYCRWGTVMDGPKEMSTSNDFTFTRLPDLERSPGSDWMFFNVGGLQTLSVVDIWNQVLWYPNPPYVPHGFLPFIRVPAASSGPIPSYTLFRRHHYPISLSAISPAVASAKKLIVLIHGWNPDSNQSQYATDPDGFQLLIDELNAQLPGTGWNLLDYSWEADADTGPNFPGPIGNSVESANAAHLHGQNLGWLLQQECPNLESLHLISHSAGAWITRAVAKRIAQSGGVLVQLTLLDPFVAGELPTSTPLTKSKLSEIANYNWGNRLWSLENYYSKDHIQSDLIVQATSCVFDWASQANTQTQVDWGTSITQLSWGHYNSHSGPVQFYAETAVAASGAGLASGLTNPNFDLDQIGWRRSMFMNEPVFDLHPTLPSSVVANSSVTLTASASTRAYPGADHPTATILYQWQTATSATGPWSGVVSGGAGSSYVFAATPDQNGKWFRLKASNVAGIAYSNAAKLVVSSTVPFATTPAAPSNLTASLSGSRVNLAWNGSNVTNEANFKIERRRSTDSWALLNSFTAAMNAVGWQDSTAQAGTTYVYRVRAVNSAAESAPTNEVSILIPPSSTGSGTVYRTLTVSSSPTLNASIGISPSDRYGLGTGSTSLSRSFANGTTVSVNAPAQHGGKYFQKWLLDPTGSGAATEFFSSRPNVQFYLASNIGLSAVYSTTPSSSVIPTSIEITGQSSVDERSSAQYSAIAHYPDNSTATISPVWDESSSYASISSTGRLDTEAVSSNKTVTIEISYTVGGTTRTDTKSVTIQDAGGGEVFRLTAVANSDQGKIKLSPSKEYYNDGERVELKAVAYRGWMFSHWSGDESGTDPEDSVRMTRDKTVTAHFTEDTSLGGIQVFIDPPEAVAEGAQWQISGWDQSDSWRDSGTSKENFAVDLWYIRLKEIPGWYEPDNIEVDMRGGEIVSVTAAYREIPCNIQVNLTPGAAQTAGARWRLDGGTWLEGGVTLPTTFQGYHTLEFADAAGWVKPASQTVTLSRGQTTVINADYQPASGTAAIFSHYPKTGPLAGGTTVTFEGVNIADPVSVTFGGIAATNVIRNANNQITAVTPARISYGTVPVVVNVGGQSYTFGNGFTYDEPVGSNMELVGQLGGSINCVTGQGSYVYVGEGAGFVVYDVSNPMSPVERGRIGLPGTVYEIEVAGTYAYVANGIGGFRVIDVSNPASPSVVGVYYTPASPRYVALSGALAYVAESFRVHVFDVSNPLAPTLLGSFTDISNQMYDMVFMNVGSQKLVLASCSSIGIKVIDVTNPASTSLLTTIPLTTSINALLVNGSTLIGGFLGSINAYSFSNPSSPVLLSSWETGGVGGMAFKDGLVYDFDSSQIVSFSNPSQPFLVTGGLPNGMLDPRATHVQNGHAYIAGFESGFQAVQVSNPANLQVGATIHRFGNVKDVKVQSGVAFLACRDDGLVTVSVSTPSRPTFMGKAKVTVGQDDKSVEQIILAGSAAYAPTQNDGLRRFSISNPAAPTMVGQYRPSSTSFYGVDVTPNEVLAVGSTSSLDFIDIVTYPGPTTPTRMGYLNLTIGSSFPWRLRYANGRAFVLDQGSPRSVHIVNVTSPSNPSLLGSFPVSSSAFALDVSSDGMTAYVAGDGVAIYDCTTATSVQQIGSYSEGVSQVSSLHLVDQKLYIGTWPRIQVCSVTNKSLITQLASYDTAGSADFVFGAGNDVFVADGQGGLCILRVLDTAVPTVQINSPTGSSQWQTTQGTIDLAGSASDDNGVARVSWTNNRGGGGEAMGTTAWSIAGLTLAAGINVITVTASDAQGRSASDSVAVNYQAPDSLPPVITLTAPALSNGELTVADVATVDFAGTASDNGALSSIIWSSDRGPSGSATGLASWSIAAIPLESGPNVVRVTATDSSGNAGTAQAKINYLPSDNELPQVEITFPVSTATMTVYSSTLSLSGTAQDNWAVQSVRWANDRGDEGAATGLLEWQAGNIPLQLGANVITITAADARNNQGTDTLNVIYRLPDQDNDGIPDESEVAYGLNPELASDAHDDADNDGMTNRAEHVAGTNPNSSADRFKLEEPVMNPGGMTLQFKTVAGKFYCIEATEDMPGTWQIVKEDILGTGGMASFTDTSALVGRTRRFYRAVVCEEQ